MMHGTMNVKFIVFTNNNRVKQSNAYAALGAL